MIPRHVEYVSEDYVLADIALKASTSASLRTSNAILLALLLLSSYILNIMLICTIYTSRKLRTSLIYLMFCHICCINILDLSFSVLISLIYIANGVWVFGKQWCQINAAVQEFCELYMLLTILLVAVERAIGLVSESTLVFQQCTFEHPRTLRKKHVMVLSIMLALASFAIAIPAAIGALQVRPFKSRYVCAIASDVPLGYTITRIFIYMGCLCVLLVCASAIFKKRAEYSLPQQSHEYSDFIRRNRAMQEYLSRAKLVALLMSIFILVEGPYICLCFTYEICNSSDTYTVDIPQDADTLITWLKFLFPLLSPVAILCWCSDISGHLKQVFCCRSYDLPIIGQGINGYKGVGVMPGVMTLVATPEGLQLKLPTSVVSLPDSVDLPQPEATAQPCRREVYPVKNNANDDIIEVRDSRTTPTTTPEEPIATRDEPRQQKKGPSTVKRRNAATQNVKGKVGPAKPRGGQRQHRANAVK